MLIKFHWQLVEVLNIKLASRLTGYKINVFSDSGDDEDVFLKISVMKLMVGLLIKENYCDTKCFR
jgi:transcription antitermination factor NusA-like protein